MMHRHGFQACCINGPTIRTAAGHAAPYLVQAPEPLFRMEVPASNPTHVHSHPHMIQYPPAHVYHHQHGALSSCKAFCINEPPEEEEEEEEGSFHFSPQPLLHFSCSSSTRCGFPSGPHLNMTAPQHQYCKHSASDCMSSRSHPFTHHMGCYGCMHSDSMISENICSSNQTLECPYCSHVRYTWDHCSAHANALLPQCCQIATHDGGDSLQESPCFAAAMVVGFPEHSCVPMGSAHVDVQPKACLYMKSVDDASDYVPQSMVSHATSVENVQAKMAAPNYLPVDLIAHTRELHSVWWSGGASIQALPEDVYKGTQSHDADGWISINRDEQTSYRNAQEKHSTEDDGFWKVEAGLEQGAKPSGDGNFRKEAQKERQNFWNNQLKNNKRRRYFPRKRSNNASTWDGPSTSNVGMMFEKPNSFKDADGWGNGNVANPSTKGTGKEPVNLYQTWEENTGLIQSKEEFFTTTCPSSYVGWTDSYVEPPKVFKEPASTDPKENDKGMQFKKASPNARAKYSAETPPSNIMRIGPKGMAIDEEGTVVLPSGNVEATCHKEGTSTWGEYMENRQKDKAQVSLYTTEGRKESALVLNTANQTMDFLSSSSDDRDLEDCLSYESDDGHYPMAGVDGDAKSLENQSYEFFKQIFEENEELKKRYKEEYGVGEFDCLVCSNIPNKPIKRYNGLVSVVMHAKGILNTKRRHDHRGFARAVCDFMGWDAHGNSIVRPSESIQPRACLLGSESIPEGDEKISNDAEDELVGGRDELVGGRDSISSEKKASQDEEASQELCKPFEANITILDESYIVDRAIEEDGNVKSELAASEVLSPLADKIAMQEESQIPGCALKADNLVPDENEEDKLDTVGQRVGLEITICEDENVIEEVFRPVEDNMTMLEKSRNIDGAIKEDNAVVEEDIVEDKLVDDLALKFDTCQDGDLENNTCRDANQVDITKNDAGNDGARICSSSLHAEGFEAGQNIVKAFREQLLDEMFGLAGRNLKKDADGEVQERSLPQLGCFEHRCEEDRDEGGTALSCEGDEAVEGMGTSKMSSLLELGCFKHRSEEDGDEGGTASLLCEGDEAVEGIGTSKMVVPCDNKGTEAEEAMTA